MYRDADDDLREYDLEHYDSDTEVRDGETMGMFGNARSLAYHESNADDPYITMQENDDEDEEREDLQILATDNMMVAAKVEDEVAHLEVYVYEDEADNLYVHHDIMLPAIPLCIEWLDLPVGKDPYTVDPDSRGNYVAVGTFDPDIEIWDLDTIDRMYPNAILGQGGQEAKADPTQELRKKKSRKKSKKSNDDSHVDPLLSFASNRHHRTLIASSSPEKTVKLWDVQPTGPSMVVSRNVDVGRVFSTKFASDPEVAFRLAVAGSKGAMQVWDTSTNSAVRRTFASRMAPISGEAKEERIVGVDEDSSDSEEEGGIEPGGADTMPENGWESMDEN